MLHISLFLFLLAIYLFTYTPRINSSDGLAMFSTAESLVRRGALDIEQIRWMGLQQGTYGLDGLLYSRKGIGLPIGLLPLTWLGLVMPWFGPVSVSLLFNALVTASTAVLLLAYVQQLGFSQRTGLIVALTFGLTTLAWPYAKSLFSDPFSGFLLLAAAYSLLKFRQHILTNERGNDKARPPARSRWHTIRYLLYPFLAGLFLGWNVATRYAELLFLPVYGLLLLHYLDFFRIRNYKSLFSWFKPRPPISNPLFPILAFSVPITLIGLVLITFNLSRYGNAFNTGYLPNETFSAILWQGVIGQLLSPGRGLLLYCPIFILSFWGLPSAFRRFRPEAGLASAIIVIHLLLYGKWFMWHGGYAWGPRFMIPTLPFWAIFLAPVVARAFRAKARPGGVGQAVSLSGPDKLLACPTEDNVSNHTKTNPDSSNLMLRMAYISLAILGLIPQLLSVTIDFAPFQNSLLDTGLPLFAPQTFFDPQYSPFIGAWAFMTHDTLDLAWAWQGQFNGWLLTILVANVFITGIHLKKQASEPTEQASGFVLRLSPKGVKYQVSSIRYHVLRFTFYVSRLTHHSLNSTLLPILSTLLALILLLTYTHALPAKPLPQTIAALNKAVRPSDVIITNNPEIAEPFAELYKGSAPVLGLNNGGFPLPEDVTRRLTEIMAEHQQVWWLPPEESAIEQTLSTNGFRARNDNFDGQRLALFAFPPNLADQAIQINTTFEKSITLEKIVYPQTTTPGVAFPIELHWQATAPVNENYHVFIHLLTDAGQIVAQADGQPVLWARPTSTWAIGETIVDRYGLWIPPETTPGIYKLSIGLYHPLDGQRLRLSNGQDLVKCKVIVL